MERAQSEQPRTDTVPEEDDGREEPSDEAGDRVVASAGEEPSDGLKAVSKTVEIHPSDTDNAQSPGEAEASTESTAKTPAKKVSRKKTVKKQSVRKKPTAKKAATKKPSDDGKSIHRRGIRLKSDIDDD